MKMVNRNKKDRLFARFSMLTLITVYILILVGGIVRSTGSGMGCPDWPKCFGSWVPPTDVDQLPDNYKEIYSQKRAVKNERFAAYLTKLGLNETAQKLLSDKSILEEADFNKTKTWIEYFNRLFGVLTGFFILGTFILAVRFLKTDKTIFYIALAALLLVIFQGWLGSVVVSTNLLPWVITVHMLVALLIVALMIYLVYRTGYWHRPTTEFKNKKLFLAVLIGCMVTSLIQIALGTQVREAIDVIAASFDYSNRSLWIENIGKPFLIHRSFSWVILVLHLALIYFLIKSAVRSKLTVWLMVIVSFTIMTGVVMAYFSIPAVVQPVHLLLGSLVFGFQFLLFLRMGNFEEKLAVK